MKLDHYPTNVEVQKITEMRIGFLFTKTVYEIYLFVWLHNVIEPRDMYILTDDLSPETIKNKLYSTLYEKEEKTRKLQQLSESINAII